jgi:hypothetical protein
VFHQPKVRLLTVILGIALLVGVARMPIHTYATGGPCSAVTGDPAPPQVDPEPLIAGLVSNAGTSAAIAGATMRLYRCSSGSGVLDATTTTNSTGEYQFADLTRAYYYVEAVMTGPLAGLTAAQGYPNPSDVIAVGAGDTAVDFRFQ